MPKKKTKRTHRRPQSRHRPKTRDAGLAEQIELLDTACVVLETFAREYALEDPLLAEDLALASRSATRALSRLQNMWDDLNTVDPTLGA